MIQIQGIDHIAIGVRDVRASVEWYIATLGLKRIHEQAWGDYPAVVAAGTSSVALFPLQKDEGDIDRGAGLHRPGMRHFAFRVDRMNYALAKRELSGRGIALTEQRHGIARSIYFHDPDGHELEITTYELGDEDA